MRIEKFETRINRIVFENFMHRLVARILAFRKSIRRKIPMKELVERIWPLPAANSRRDTIIPLKWLNKFFSLQKDGEYLAYLLVKVAILYGALTLAILTIDIFGRLGLAIDQTSFQHNKLLLPEAYKKLTAIPFLILAIIFYLRFRLTINIKNDTIPVFVHRALLVGYSRRTWIFRCLFMIIMSVAGVFVSDIVLSKFILHFHQENSIVFVWLVQLFGVLGTGPLAVILMCFALTLEKSIRFFPEFEQDLLTMNPLPRNY